MARQLSDILERFSQMDSETQLERIRQIRKTKHYTKPATIERKAKSDRKASNAAKARIEKLMGGMSPEERAAILEQIRGGNE